MSSTTFCWHDNQRRFKKDTHALFGASNYHWINYTDEKMIRTKVNSKAKKQGTELHELACMLIKQKVKLPDVQQTLNMYVNDCILYGMRPEVQLYYSDDFFGTADGLGVEPGILRCFDLKTGETKASMHQLEIYVALFCLEYDFIPSDFEDIETRIYQKNDIIIAHPGTEEIAPIMDKIVTYSELFKTMEDESYEQ